MHLVALPDHWQSRSKHRWNSTHTWTNCHNVCGADCMERHNSDQGMRLSFFVPWTSMRLSIQKFPVKTGVELLSDTLKNSVPTVWTGFYTIQFYIWLWFTHHRVWISLKTHSLKCLLCSLSASVYSCMHAPILVFSVTYMHVHVRGITILSLGTSTCNCAYKQSTR